MDPKFIKKIQPYLGVVFVQCGYAVFTIIAKSALDKGMSHYSFSVYRNVVAALFVAPFAIVFERKIRPRMTWPVFYKIILLALLEPVIDQNLYYMGMKYTTATFTSAMCNVLPAITFVLAWALRVERVDVRRLQGQAKIMGTLVTVGGAMIMTLAKGSVIGLPWIQSKPKSEYESGKAHQDPIKGAVLITAACVCWSVFYLLQANTLKSYPAGLSLTSLLCMAGALLGAMLTLAVERTSAAVWSIGWDIKLVAYAYGGIMCSAVTYYVSGAIMEEKGPVFVTSFNPLNMVIVAVLSSFTLSEQLDVGKVAGAMVIVIGLYLVIWGKSKDQKRSFSAETEIPDPKNGTSDLSGKESEATMSGDSVV